MLGSTYLEILRDDLTNIIIIFYAVFKEQTIVTDCLNQFNYY